SVRSTALCSPEPYPLSLHDALPISANPHLRGVITAMLDRACRPGEILSLQWRDVSLDRRELTIRAEKEKTRRERIIPISTRLMADRKSTRLNSSHDQISYAVFCLKK